jgi:hypothetical protein
MSDPASQAPPHSRHPVVVNGAARAVLVSRRGWHRRMRPVKLLQHFGQIGYMSEGSEIGEAADIRHNHVPDARFASRQIEAIALQDLSLSKRRSLEGESDALGEWHGANLSLKRSDERALARLIFR